MAGNPKYHEHPGRYKYDGDFIARMVLSGQRLESLLA